MAWQSAICQTKDFSSQRNHLHPPHARYSIYRANLHFSFFPPFREKKKAKNRIPDPTRKYGQKAAAMCIIKKITLFKVSTSTCCCGCMTAHLQGSSVFLFPPSFPPRHGLHTGPLPKRRAKEKCRRGGSCSFVEGREVCLTALQPSRLNGPAGSSHK